MPRNDLVKAFAYLRTSSSTNLGDGKDSQPRQRAAIEAFAQRRGFTIVGTFSDDAVSGEDDIASRAGFSAMLDALEANGTRTVIVEDASRFARKMLVQELGIVALISRRVTCWSAAGDLELTNSDDEFKVAMRQIAAAFHQLEKARLVKRLKRARDLRTAQTGKCGGRKSYSERNPHMVAMAKKLHRYTVEGRKRSLRNVAAELAKQGHVMANGKPYSATAVARMISA